MLFGRLSPRLTWARLAEFDRVYDFGLVPTRGTIEPILHVELSQMR